MKLFLPGVLVAIVLLSCMTSPQSYVWIEGSWLMIYPNGKNRLETWKLIDNRNLEGTGFAINGKDSTIIEYLKLNQTSDGVYYVPRVPDQNDGKEVRFKLVNKNKELVFENPGHDFPQRILYRYLPSASAEDKDSMFVRVESLKGEGIDYWFQRQ